MKKSFILRLISILLVSALLVGAVFAITAADYEVPGVVEESTSVAINLKSLVMDTVDPDPVIMIVSPPTLGSVGDYDSLLGTVEYSAPDDLADDEILTTFEYQACETVDAEANGGVCPDGSPTGTITINLLPVNDPPVCDDASASDDMIWPPNHKMTGVDIEGVTDEEDEPEDIVIKIVDIDEEEPVIDSDEPDNGTGDGNTTGDSEVVMGEEGESDSANVRAERKGNGDGRVYTIHFEAEDTGGATCTGDVTVTVPHDASEFVDPPGNAYGLDKDKNEPNGNAYAYGHDEEHTAPNGNANGHDKNNVPNGNANGHDPQDQQEIAPANNNSHNSKSDENKDKDDNNDKKDKDKKDKDKNDNKDKKKKNKKK